MNRTDKTILEQWIEKADHDLITTQMIIDSNPIILDIACFHCQQAVEKLLKAFLLYKGQELMKTHNLDILLKKCSNIDIDFLKFNFKNLDDFAVRARYPEYLDPELSEAQEYYQIALNVKELVLQKIEL